MTTPIAVYPSIRIENVIEVDRLYELWQIDQTMYPDCVLSFEEFSQWWNCYGLGSKILLQDNKITASIGIYPLDNDQAWAFQHGAIPEAAIIPPSVTQCAEQPVSNWYFSGIFVVPKLQGWASPVRKLLRTGISVWLDSGHIQYPARLIALASSENGRNWLEYFGFTKVKDGSELPDGCDLYQLEARNDRFLGTLLREKCR